MEEQYHQEFGVLVETGVQIQLEEIKKKVYAIPAKTGIA